MQVNITHQMQGWPEAAMAGILGIALAGPRVYSTHKEDGNWINTTGSQIN